MKNFLLLFALVLGMSFVLTAQGLKILNRSDVEITGATIDIDGVPTDATLEVAFKVTNQSGNSMNVKVKKEELAVVTATVNYFCWVSCYNASTMESPDYLTIADGETVADKFKGDYEPAGHSGTTTIKYTFFDADNTSMESSVTVNFNAVTAGIEDFSFRGNAISDAYPNPARTHTNFSFHTENGKKATLALYTLSGKAVRQIQLPKQSGEYRLETADLPSGMYFVNFLVDGKVLTTKRLTVQ